MLRRMFRNIDHKHSIIYGLIAGVLSCIPIYFYLRDISYANSWLLYIGAMIFFVVITLHVMVFRNRHAANPSAVTAIFASHVTTIIGVFTSMAVCLLMTILFVPGFAFGGVAEAAQTDAPSAVAGENTGGIGFRTFAGTFIANFTLGSFASIIWPFYMKRNQTRDARDPSPLHQRGVQ